MYLIEFLDKSYLPTSLALALLCALSHGLRTGWKTSPNDSGQRVDYRVSGRSGFVLFNVFINDLEDRVNNS